MAGPEVWVIAEPLGEGVTPVSLELLGKAMELAHSAYGGDGVVAGVLIGTEAPSLVSQLAAHGAQRVYVFPDPRLHLSLSDICVRVTAQLVRECQPEVVLVGATALGTDLAARLAARLETGLTAHCIDLFIAEQGGKKQLVQVVPGWGGNVALRILCPERRPQMATVRPGVLERPAADPKRSAQVVRIMPQLTEHDFTMKIVEAVEEKAARAALEAAPVVVAGGWGLQCAGGIEGAQHLCQLLGGAMAGTRPMVDKGLLPEERMLGHSGKSVSPRLLVALGASGAVHFTSGFLRAQVVFAIDRNPQAPIFQVCDVGIVGDLQELLPLLTEELKSSL